ncbi:MAG: hypothetical protein PHC35_01405 [Deltaproteobacteria bacterium]|jgi:hypothetical protein|nr:hypothetical protein [Deltaproteobacteria bacterium]
MKILPNQSNTPIVSSRHGNGSDASGISFDDLLTKLSIAGPASVQNAAPLSSVGAAAPVSDAARSDAMQNAYDTLDVLERMEWTLTTSSGFSTSAKETFSSLLNGFTDRLKASRDSLDAHDPLVDILNQIGVTAVVERARLEKTGNP